MLTTFITKDFNLNAHMCFSGIYPIKLEDDIKKELSLKKKRNNKQTISVNNYSMLM